MAIFQPQIVGKGGGSNQDIQYDVMPEATIENLGRVIQYVGETIPDIEASAVVTQTVGSSLEDLVVDVEKFEKTENPKGAETVDFVCSIEPAEYVAQPGYEPYFPCEIDVNTFIAACEQNGWDYSQVAVYYNHYTADQQYGFGWDYENVYYDDVDAAFLAQFGITVPETPTGAPGGWGFFHYKDSTFTWSKNEEKINLSDYGVTYLGEPEDGDTLRVTYSPFIGGYANGYFYKNQPKLSDPTIAIAQTVGNLTELSVDIDKFIETEQPTQDETVDFVSSGIQYITTPTHWNNYGLDITIDDVNLFINQILERRPDVSITREGNNIQNFYFCCIYNERQINKIVIRANSYQTEYNVDSSWGVTINGDQSDDPNTWRDYYINTVSVKDRWVKDDEVVNISDYGISYEGIPVEGDTLTVEYVAPSVIGYNWVQKDVQDQPEIPKAGIDWKTKVDLPSNYPSGYEWSCAPIYTVQGGLPDGKYEVFWQIKTNKVANHDNAPWSVVTYKAEFGICNNHTLYYGQIGYIIDGQWTTIDSSYYPTNNPYYNIFYNNTENGDFLFFSTNTIFRTDISAYRRGSFVPECFKLSAIKNLDTGEEYIATGELYNGSNYPQSIRSLSGYLSTSRLAPEQSIATYYSWNGSSYDQSGSGQYIRIYPEYSIRINENGQNIYPNCSELDVSIVTSNGGKYHVVVENSMDSYIAREIEPSTGDLANTQIGWDTYGRAYVYLNIPAGNEGNYEISVAIKGGDRNNSAGISMGYNIPGTFTPAVITKVGGTITKSNLGFIEQYKGNSTLEYKKGYFYQATGTVVENEILEASWYDGCQTATYISSVDGFITALSNYTGWSKNYIKENFLNLNHYFQYNPDSNEHLYWSCYGDIYDANVLSYLSFSPEPTWWTAFRTVYQKTSEIQNARWQEVPIGSGGGGSGSQVIFRKWVTTQGA